MEVDAAARHHAVGHYEEDVDDTETSEVVDVVELVELEEEMGDADSVERFPVDDTEEGDTTSEQYRNGRDIQGIAWERLNFTREEYRENRLKQYRNYTNVLEGDPEVYRDEIAKKCSPVHRDGHYYDFVRNNRAVHSTIMHFQLRNLVWATSQNDVFIVHEHAVNHWSPVTRTPTTVLNLSGPPKAPRVPGVGRVQISTLCVAGDVVAAGGFTGELVVKRLSSPNVAYSGRVTASENGITNAIEIFDSERLGQCLMASNNDSIVRLFDLETMAPKGRFEYPWAVNCSMLHPTSGTLLAVVGDDQATHLTDALSGLTVNQLKKHQDYSFAVAWHPDGNLLATGNQDTTTLVWDIRYTASELAMLPGRMGAIRSIRFSADGTHMAVAEPADFVHIYDVQGGFQVCQEIDIFGEIAGFSFSPDGEDLVVGVADITYSSLLHYERHHDQQETDLERLMPYPHRGVWS